MLGDYEILRAEQLKLARFQCSGSDDASEGFGSGRATVGTEAVGTEAVSIFKALDGRSILLEHSCVWPY